MTDLYTALAVMIPLAVAVGWAAHRLTRRWSPVAVGVAAAVVLGVAVVNLVRLRDSLWPARFVPSSALIVYAELTPLLVAALVGLSWRILPGAPGRRCVLVGPLVGLALFHAYGPLVAKVPGPLSNRWVRGCCRQSTLATCGPAAAATLLAAHAIPATEPEMAGLCLTSIDGTSLRGIYRGLALKSAGADLRPQPVRCSIDELPAHAPILLSVWLEDPERHDPRFARDWGWAPGVRHVVVLLARRSDGLFVVADPACGPETWDRLALETLWHGDAIRLAPVR